MQKDQFKIVSEPIGLEFKSQEEQFGVEKIYVTKSTPTGFDLRGSVEKWALPEGKC